MTTTTVDTDASHTTTDWVDLAASIADDLRPRAADRDRSGVLDPAPYHQIRDVGLTSARFPPSSVAAEPPTPTSAPASASSPPGTRRSP